VVSTNAITLEGYRDAYPVVDLLLDYRKASKRYTGYKSWPEFISPITGRIHPHWNAIGSKPGRMSVSEPGVHGIPRDPVFRRCIIPDDPNWMVLADYPAIEMRVAAAISGDPKLLALFEAGVDIHCWLASQITGVPIEDITDDSEARQSAKAANFGLLYGQQVRGFIRYAWQNFKVRLTYDEAVHLKEMWHQAFPVLTQWQEAQKGKTETRSILGRRRTWKGTPPWTELLNTPVQSSAADGMKLAVIYLMDKLNTLDYDAYPIMVRHDELVLEAPKAKCLEVKAILEEAMIEGMRQVIPEVPTPVKGKVCYSMNTKDPVPPEELARVRN
jgi:DNA polymerase-1